MLNGGVGLLAGADAFQPVAHVGDGRFGLDFDGVLQPLLAAPFARDRPSAAVKTSVGAP